MFVKFDGIPVHSNCNSSESEMLLRIFKGLWLASFGCPCEICFLPYFNYFNVFWQPSMRTNRFLTLLIEQNQEFHYLRLYKKKCLFEKGILLTYLFHRVQYYYLRTEFQPANYSDKAKTSSCPLDYSSHKQMTNLRVICLRQYDTLQRNITWVLGFFHYFLYSR